MSTVIQQPATIKKQSWAERRAEKKAEKLAAKTLKVSSPVSQLIAPAELKNNFYERAIEWTHRADKVINLVLGYLLAIASVLGFMDVLSNGQVLSQVPFMFYVWLGIMGLGVDFQILLVIGRIPDLFHMPVAGWQKWLIFLFNVCFLIFLAVMSIVISAVFTQHKDMAGQASITDAMNALSINSILFVYGRAALATLLLVLMAVDRTMERWRMQITATSQYVANAAQTVTPMPVQQTAAPAVQVSDLDKMLQTIVTMNQANLQAMQDMNNQTLQQVSQFTVSIMEESINKLSANISLPAGAMLPQLGQGVTPVQVSDGSTTTTGKLPDLDPPTASKMGEQNMVTGKSFQDEIDELLQREPNLTDREIAARVGCSLKTANKWRVYVTPVQA